MTPDRSHTQELIGIRERTLRVLEKQQAEFGNLHAPVHLITQIDQTREEIERLRAQRQREVVRDIVIQEEQPTPTPGLMLLVGPGHIFQSPKNQSTLDAIDFHRRALRYCWLIGSPASLAVAYEIQTFCTQRSIKACVWGIKNPYSDIQEMYDLVDWLYTYEVSAAGLSEQDVIADITGATKPMSFGMLLACGARRPIQYMVRQPNGPSVPMMLRYRLDGAQL